MLALLCLASNAFALGLGDISVRSYLGQPFEARIELISRTPEELAELSASLASADSFRMVGIERMALSVPLEFTVDTQASPAYVEVRSQAPVKDPILQFVVEVGFANGRILKQYTVFLDPPSFPAPVPLPTVTPRPREASPEPRKAPPVVEPAKPDRPEAQAEEILTESPSSPTRDATGDRAPGGAEATVRDPASAAPRAELGQRDAGTKPEATASPSAGEGAAREPADAPAEPARPDSPEAWEEPAAETREELAEPEPSASSASAPDEPVIETVDESAVGDPPNKEPVSEPVNEPSDVVADEVGDEANDEPADETVDVPGPPADAATPATESADEGASDVSKSPDSVADDASEQPAALEATEGDAGGEPAAASEPAPTTESSAEEIEPEPMPAGEMEATEPGATEPEEQAEPVEQVEQVEQADVEEVVAAEAATTDSAETAEPGPAATSEPRQARYQVQLDDLQTYGPVQRGDTLWGIASDVAAGSGHSINQVMLAIQRYNPEAFSRDNINLLKQGAILRLPPVDEMALLTAREAMLEAMRQADAFADIRAGRQPAERPPLLPADATVERPPATQEAGPGAEPEGRLELVPPPSVADSAARGTGPGGEGEGAADAGSESGAGRRLSEEELASVQAESDYLAEQLKELEAEIAGDGAAVGVEDPGLAELEERLRAERQADEPDQPVALTPAGEGADKSSRFGWWLVLPLLAVIGLTAWWLHRRAGRAAAESRLEAALERDDAMGAVKAISNEAEQILAVLESAPGAKEGGQRTDAEETQADEGGDEPDREGLETLLDLARAHIATGDPEAARALLEKVVANGDASQVAEAKHMLREV